MITGAYKYVYELLWGPMCPKGDIICEFVGTPVLPEKLCNFIATTEEVTGIHRYVTGVPVLAFTGYVGYQIYKKKYGATDPLDLIRKIIEKEFGVGSTADKIFNIFVKEIETSVDAALKEFATKFKVNSEGLSISQQAELRKNTKKQIIEQTAAALPMHLQDKRDQFQVPAAQLSNLEKIKYVDYRVAYNIPDDQVAPCMMVPVDGSGRPIAINIPESSTLALGEQGATLSLIKEQASAQVKVMQEQASARLQMLAHEIVNLPEQATSALRFDS